MAFRAFQYIALALAIFFTSMFATMTTNLIARLGHVFFGMSNIVLMVFHAASLLCVIQSMRWAIRWRNQKISSNREKRENLEETP